MKRSFKLFTLYFFIVLFSACLPHEKLTGRVIDLTGPVPEAAVLGMLWIEDADETKPEPDVKNLTPDDRTAIYEKDIKERGLPMAYTRAFSDRKGWFTLDKLHFSAETKKAVKAMKQPKITRITVLAFQRGYLKHAVTTFLKDSNKELPAVTITLFKPENWKELALDNFYRTLRRDEYDAGYSKEFGATKEEKAWFLEYTNSNLGKAYAESNIKGEKQWEEDCGHDYSDMIISTAGIQRNPAQEKCNQLLWQMGVLREWKEPWLDHTVVKQERAAAAINAVKEALNNLDAKYAEVKANESQIIAGVVEIVKEYETGQTNQDVHNGLNEGRTGTEEAQRIYNTGDKAGAYRVLGRGLYSQLPEEVRYGALTAQLTLKITLGITDTVAGFYLLVNKPLTAQLPNGDNGNHKDKPGYKVEGATETVSQPRKSLKALVMEIKATTEPKEQLKVKMQLLRYIPQNAVELNDLLDVAEAEEKGGDIQRDILRSLKNLNLKDPKLGPVFYKRMKKKGGDPYVRTIAINHLAGLKYKEAIPDLIKLVDDFNYNRGKEKEEDHVAMAAFYALGEMGDDRAIPAVMRKLGKMGTYDPRVIARFGVKVLPQLLDKAKNSTDKQEKESAYNAVNAIEDEKAIPLLWQTFQEEKASRLRSACAGALLSLLTDRTTPTKKQLRDYIFQEAQKDREIFGMGYYAVLLARQNNDVEYLIRVLQDEKSLRNLRTDAIIALGALKAQEAISVLEETLKNPDREIQMESASALKKITGKDYSGGTK